MGSPYMGGPRSNYPEPPPPFARRSFPLSFSFLLFSLWLDPQLCPSAGAGQLVGAGRETGSPATSSQSFARLSPRLQSGAAGAPRALAPASNGGDCIKQRRRTSARLQVPASLATSAWWRAGGVGGEVGYFFLTYQNFFTDQNFLPKLFFF